MTAETSPRKRMTDAAIQEALDNYDRMVMDAMRYRHLRERTPAPEMFDALVDGQMFGKAPL